MMKRVYIILAALTFSRACSRSAKFKQVWLCSCLIAALMLLCLAPMPYGYYMLALLFQPIYKIALGRVTWNVIDMLVAVLLIALFVLEKRLEKKTTVSYQPLPPQEQPMLEDNEIVFKLGGKLAPRELVYVATEEDKAMTELFETRPTEEQVAIIHQNSLHILKSQ